jgi:hypothetical protein
MVDLLVDKGVQVEFDVGEAIEWSNICHAVRRGSLAEVENLSQGGAALNFHGISRKATIDIAIESAYDSIIEYLVANVSKGRLGWNFESSAIKRWAKEPWFPHLQTLLVPAKALKTESRIECRTWSEEKKVRVGRDSPYEPYVEAYIPADLLSLDRIVFRTGSHDQGQSMTTSSLFARWLTYEKGWVAEETVKGLTKIHTHGSMLSSFPPLVKLPINSARTSKEMFMRQKCTERMSAYGR